MTRYLSYSTAVALVIGTMVSSCKKNFLNLTPRSTTTVATFYRTTEDLTNAVNAAYGALQSPSQYSAVFVTLMEVRGDNLEDNNPGGNAGRDYTIDRFSAGAENANLQSAWSALYNSIYSCNVALANLQVVSDPALRNQYEGELRFLRALHYFNIVRLWGPAPLVLQPITTAQAYAYKRSSVKALYDAIAADLTNAAKLLPASYTNSNDLGRATAGAANGLLGKVYLTAQQYAPAATVLKTVIQSNAYSLLNDVALVFDVNNKMNAEIIFAVRYNKTIPGQGYIYNQYYNRPVLDPNLLNAYQAGDARRDLLNLQVVNNNTSTVKKFYDTFDPTTLKVGNDFPVLRFADVLLMYAEALNEQAYDGNATRDAFTFLNKVRARAGAGTYTPANLPNQAAFRSAIYRERRLEFPLENQRWFDLVRTKMAIAAFQNTGLTKINIQEWQYLYPVPLSEIQIVNDPVGFGQNQGY